MVEKWSLIGCLLSNIATLMTSHRLKWGFGELNILDLLKQMGPMSLSRSQKKRTSILKMYRGVSAAFCFLLSQFSLPSQWVQWCLASPFQSQWTPSGCLPSCTPPVPVQTCGGWRTAADARWCSWSTIVPECLAKFRNEMSIFFTRLGNNLNIVSRNNGYAWREIFS